MVEVRAAMATARARSGRGVLESICDAHLDLGGRVLASDLVHGSVRPAWRPQHQREQPLGQPGTLDDAVRHASRPRPPREWLRSRRGPWRGAVLADILERDTCRSAAHGASLGLPQRHSKLCHHWESPLRRPSVRRHSQFLRAEHLRSHPWVRGVHRRHLGSRRRAPRPAQREGLPLGGRAPRRVECNISSVRIDQWEARIRARARAASSACTNLAIPLLSKASKPFEWLPHTFQEPHDEVQ